MKKARGRKPKAANAVAADANHRDQEHRETACALPHVPQTTSNFYSPALHYFVTVQNHHLTRLRYLFPEINPTALKKILGTIYPITQHNIPEDFHLQQHCHDDILGPCIHLSLTGSADTCSEDLCQGDFIRTVDKLLSLQRNVFIHRSCGNKPSDGSFGNRTTAAHPYISTHGSSNNNSVTMVESPFKIPMVQSSQKMPYINQTAPSNYHTNQYPGINNSVPMQTPVFFQGSTVSAPPQFIQNCNQFSEHVPCPALPNCRPNVSPVQTTNTRQPSTEQLKPMLLAPSTYSDMPLPLLYETNGNASNFHGQYLMKPPQMVRPNLVPATQETDCSHLTAYNISEQPRNSTNQVIHKTTPETFAKQQAESWFQQQQQQQGDETQILELLDNILPLVTHQSHQAVNEASVPLLPPPSSRDSATAPIQTVSTAADVQCQEGKSEDGHSKSYTTNEVELMPDVEVTQKIVTEDMKVFRATSDANFKKFPAKGSGQLQEENEQCSFTGRNISDYLDETSPSEDSSLIIDMDGEQHKNTGGDNGLGHYVEAVVAEEQSPRTTCSS